MKTPTFRAKGKMAPRFVADFDSTTAMLKSLGNFLSGKDFPGVGIFPTLGPIAPGVNRLPGRIRETIATWGAFNEAVPPDSLWKVRAEEISKWVINHYPKKRKYPAIMVGSPSGAMVHLAAALCIPWLPQTFLIPVRRPPELHIDEPKRTIEWSKEPARLLLDNNPELQLYQMFDPNHDRLTLKRMAYFRIKRLCLGIRYERFLRESLEEGGAIITVECQSTWPTTKVDDRHIFQFGGMGGATEEDYLAGTRRVEEFLKRYNPRLRRWDAPEPDGYRPESEWGFDQAIMGDIERVAKEGGFKIKRIVFKDPEHLSPPVADLYRWWYRSRGIPANRLFAECFIVHEPFWALRTGSVPFWMSFNMEASADWLEEYLQNTELYDEIFLTLFSNGVDSVDLAPIERWRSILAGAKKRGDFIGVDPDEFPMDFGVFIKYYTDLKKKITARYPIPEPLTLSQVEDFLKHRKGIYPVQWLNSI
ncbi:hypothetical protein ANME2D_00051 [Candidatus Methanoperedens nitroreducens]|uniref:Uncharacterized protein n=1 Tax=Candidatus Methanoperedens nitratireducens TaxID=1392998 RepID=A0A062V6S4_9EURY|nr:hypothetical protein [Candidatus Methanoperedens nitroreducens]KCZ72992.1 hypothetical protein ANME2D_00051 [Candidatus Methanoperedens nitroreducens]MDJ1423064.1 hypothetical protein [Candidatus Methanoperedens sp.]